MLFRLGVQILAIMYKEAVRNLKTYLKKQGKVIKLPKRATDRSIYYAFDSSYPDIDKSVFVHHDWKSSMVICKRQSHWIHPPPRGKDIDLIIYVDSKPTGDKWNKSLRSGVIDAQYTGDMAVEETSYDRNLHFRWEF